MAHFLLWAVYVMVDKLHHFARIETVSLAEVYEQTAVASLCLARTALPLASATIPLASFSSAFTPDVILAS